MITAIVSGLKYAVDLTKGEVTFLFTFPESELEPTAKLYVLKSNQVVHVFVKHEQRVEQAYIGKLRMEDVHKMKDGQQKVSGWGYAHEVFTTEIAVLPKNTTFELIVFTEEEMAKEAQKRMQQERAQFSIAEV